jgi:hypothetical protein
MPQRAQRRCAKQNDAFSHRLETGILAQSRNSGGRIGVAPFELPIRETHNGIDGADLFRLRIEPVDQRNDGYFMRQCNICAQNMRCAQRCDPMRQFGAAGAPPFIARSDAEMLKRGIVQERRQAVIDWIADDPG